MSAVWRSGRANSHVNGDIARNAYIDISDLELAWLALRNRIIRFCFERFDDAIATHHSGQGGAGTAVGAGVRPSSTRYAD